MHATASPKIGTATGVRNLRFTYHAAGGSNNGMPTKPKAATKKTAAGPNKRGRPSIHTDEVRSEICRQLHESDGDELPKSLRAICRDPAMPNISTVCEWLNDKPDFAKQYARARELRKDALVDRMMALAKDAKDNAHGMPGTGEAGARVTAYKIEIDAIKWILSKEYARDYGDLLKQEISGPEGGAIEVATRERDSDDEKRFAKLLAEADRTARPSAK